MELITGAPDAQYGDKSSLVVNAVTKSGLGAQNPFGSFETAMGLVRHVGEKRDAWASGRPKFGNFVALNGIRTGHFLDTPEFLPIHDIGNNETIFDRVDYQPDRDDIFHLNLFLGPQLVPGSQQLTISLRQDQKQRVLTWNVAPGYQHTFGRRRC